MITVGKEQYLGNRSQVLFVSRRTTIAFAFFIVCLVLMAVNVSLSVGISGLFSMGGTPDQATTLAISGIISKIALGAFLLTIISGLLGVIVGILQYRSFVFTMDELSLKIRHGFINRHEVLLPYRLIQDIKIVRPWLYRIIGVSRMVLVAAGDDVATIDHRDKDTVFDPIDVGLAEEMRSFLERHVGVQIIQDKAEVVSEEKKEEVISQD